MDVSSDPRPNLFPFLVYDDAPAAMDWLEEAFGFERRAVHLGDDGSVAHAELAFEGGVVMLGSSRDNDFGLTTVAALGGLSNQGIYVVVRDVDALWERARAAGAEVVRELAATDYGSREFMVRDPGRNLWSFGTYDPHAVEGTG